MTSRLTQGLRRAAQINGDGVATIDNDRKRTWGEVLARVTRLAGGLRALGVADGERVAVLSLNSDRFLESYYAVAWAGGVVLPLNTRLTAGEIAEILADAEARILMVDDAHLPILGELGDVGIAARIHMGDGPPPDGLHAFETLIADSAPIPDAGRGGDDIAGLFYTGGSTGRPKGVMLSHHNLVSNAGMAMYMIGYDRTSVYLHAGPMFHLADGMSTFAVTALGGTHVFMQRFTPESCLEVMAQHRVTDVALVPTMVKMLLDVPGLADYDLSSLRQIVFGSAPMPEATLKKAAETWPDLPLLHGWGMTETSPIGTQMPHDKRLPRVMGDTLKSCGQAAPLTELKIVDENDEEVPTGEVGEILYRGPNVMLGYWRRPEETAAAFTEDGWFRTGDMARMDEEGLVYIVDRLKDMVISGGFNIYSTEVENVISLMPAVAQVAVIGIPHEQWGEAVHAVIVPKAGAEVTLESLQAHCRQHLASYKIPRSMEIREESLPLSGAGKVVKTELRAAHREKAAG